MGPGADCGSWRSVIHPVDNVLGLICWYGPAATHPAVVLRCASRCGGFWPLGFRVGADGHSTRGRCIRDPTEQESRDCWAGVLSLVLASNVAWPGSRLLGSVSALAVLRLPVPAGFGPQSDLAARRAYAEWGHSASGPPCGDSTGIATAPALH